MTKGDYIRQCDDKQLAREFTACAMEAIGKTISALGINISDIVTDEMVQELLATCEKELGEEYVE